MFNRPRISLWPVQQETDPNNGKPGCPDHPRTSQDDLFAACATLKQAALLFPALQRLHEGRHSTIAARIPTIPLRSKAACTRRAASGRISIGESRAITSSTVICRTSPSARCRAWPGGVKFTDKLGADRDQLLTSMVDLLRTANDLKPSDLARKLRLLSAA